MKKLDNAIDYVQSKMLTKFYVSCRLPSNKTKVNVCYITFKHELGSHAHTHTDTHTHTEAHIHTHTQRLLYSLLNKHG